MSNSYLNPVYRHSFPDPFVLKYRGEYWAYGTGIWHDGRCFGVLHSRDLVEWREVCGAMEPLPGNFPCYWAPEVTYDNGRFFLYYSVGNEERMHIRVAVAEHPGGPFVDSGRRLTSEPFAIDAHVFEDDDGTRYLFYATDFLERDRVGTGTVRDRLLDPFTLAGQPHPVTLPHYDWQIYDPRRVEKGGVCWHTVEGPFVLKHKDRYYQMFSGGNWKNTSYGVCYGVSNSIAAPREWSQACDDERGRPILRTVPRQVDGPGHNSVVRGPDNRQLFCIYHRWVPDAAAPGKRPAPGRVIAIDRLEWAGERMLVLGPSTVPQPAPLPPTFADFFDGNPSGDLGPRWTCTGGRWIERDGAAVQESLEPLAEARCAAPAPSFLVEVSLRALGEGIEQGAFGVGLWSEREPLLRCMVVPAQRQVIIARRMRAGWSEQSAGLPSNFEPRAYHLLRLEVDGRRVHLQLNGTAARWEGFVAAQPVGTALCTEQMAAAFAGFALTVGWLDLFMEAATRPEELDWEPSGDAESWSIRDRQLWHRSPQSSGMLAKGPLLESYELVVNARLGRERAADGCYGFFPALLPDGSGTLLTVPRSAARWVIQCQEPPYTRAFLLPPEFDPSGCQQFRFRKTAGQLTIQWEGQVLGEVKVPAGATRVGLHAHHAVAAFDMVRVTAIPES